MNSCYYCALPTDQTEPICPHCGSALLLRERYQITGVLGAGGFGTVLAAQDLRLNRRVAVKKVVSASLLDQRRVEAEAALLSQFAPRFPFIPDIYDFWSAQGQTFLVMEYIDGRTVDELRALPWPVGQVETFLRTLLAYLAEVHAAGVVHRDIKPANIVCTTDGRFVLLDFGIAKQGTATQTAARGLTPSYAAPEQVRGDPTDARSDLYSLAATAWHLLTGSPPPSVFARWATPASGLETLDRLPDGLAAALRALLALRPEDRPADAAAALTLLDAGPSAAADAAVGSRTLPVLAAAPAVTVGEITAAPAAPAPRRRQRVAALAIPALALAGLTGWLLLPPSAPQTGPAVLAVPVRATETATLTPSATPSATPTLTASATSTPTPTASATPTPSASPTPTRAAVRVAPPAPPSPSAAPPAPTAEPTAPPAPSPTSADAAGESAPTDAPSNPRPTRRPAASTPVPPTTAPTDGPTSEPTLPAATAYPGPDDPTARPTAAATAAATSAATSGPTAASTAAPTSAATSAATTAPTSAATSAATTAPTSAPTRVPTP